MTTESAPFYWLTCDNRGCAARSPDPGSDEHSAWVDESQARLYAEDSGWKLNSHGKDLCAAHAAFVCEECGAKIDVKYPGEQDYLCTPCYEAPAPIRP